MYENSTKSDIISPWAFSFYLFTMQNHWREEEAKGKTFAFVLNTKSIICLGVIQKSADFIFGLWGFSDESAEFLDQNFL